MIKKSQSNLILYLLILLGFVGGYFYNSKINITQAGVQPLPQEGRDEWQKLKSLSIDFSVLEKAQYRSLRVFGELPVNPGIPGKPNIFGQ